MSRTTTNLTALVLSRPGILTAATRARLEGWRRVLPNEPHYQPLRGRWNVLGDGPLPDLIVAEHADPLLVAMLCTDLLRSVWLHEGRMLVLIGERDDALRQLLAPLPLPLTVISPRTLLREHRLTTEERACQCDVRWSETPAPGRILPRWQVVPLTAALARARNVAEAAAWCSMARSTAYTILALTARHLSLCRRWRSPRQWSHDLVAALIQVPVLEPSVP